jgi:AraC-like DNA-binding protein
LIVMTEWTGPELAAVSGLSRAAFARSFQEALGQARCSI